MAKTMRFRLSNTLHLPDVTGLTMLAAALAYAAEGWFVFPVRPGTKRPAIDNWDENSSDDPDQIEAWWTENPRYGIALHVGRSGAVAFDLDELALAVIVDGGRPDIAEALASAGGINGTRKPEISTERAHYLFACDEGEFGNSAGDFGRWGEVRGRNGYIVVAPTPHPDADTKDGHYWQIRTGELTPVPDVLRAVLAAPGKVAEPLSFDEFEAWLDDDTIGDEKACGIRGCRHSIAGLIAKFEAKIAAGASRYVTMCTDVGPWGFREALAGCYRKRAVLDALKDVYEQVKPGERNELYRALRWAAAQAQASPGNAHGDTGYADVGDSVRAMGDFWESSENLQWLRQHARARLVPPAAMLGASLARVVSAIPPFVVLPGTIGSVASLNQNFALVGPSGSAKSTSIAAMKDWLTVAPNYIPKKPGTTEGLRKCFARKQMKDVNGKPQLVQVGKQWSVLAIVPEVDSLTAANKRSLSMMSELRQAWSGEDLAEDFADETKTILLRGNRYRFAMVLGVQPGRAKPLFDDADGGTPQRFIWLPAVDPDIPDIAPDDPPRLDLPRWPGMYSQGIADPDTVLNAELGNEADAGEYQILGIPDSVRQLMQDTMREIQRGNPDVDPLNGHKNLVRLKLAAALMALECRYDAVTQEDWDRAGVVMAVSDATRQSIQELHRSEAERINESRGKMDGIRASVAEDTKHNRDVARVTANVLKKLKANDGAMTHNALRKSFHVRDRDCFDYVEKSLISSGQIKSIDGTEKGHVIVLLGEV